MGDSWVEVEVEWGEWKEGGRPPKPEGGEEVKDFSSSSEEGKVRKCQKSAFLEAFLEKKSSKKQEVIIGGG